jgi:hypothetical protein
MLAPFLNDFHGNIRVLCSLTQPNYGILRLAVNIRHQQDLLASFGKVRLVDTDLVNPYRD